mmetsp:Transcript_12512/g.36372  ORF Transcript_12512/g.36372 Transcript_12512/m.36372 type:complete len:221 (+) Transcript_12512:993-1655(+)
MTALPTIRQTEGHGIRPDGQIRKRATQAAGVSKHRLQAHLILNGTGGIVIRFGAVPVRPLSLFATPAVAGSAAVIFVPVALEIVHVNIRIFLKVHSLCLAAARLADDIVICSGGRIGNLLNGSLLQNKSSLMDPVIGRIEEDGVLKDQQQISPEGTVQHSGDRCFADSRARRNGGVLTVLQILFQRRNIHRALDNVEIMRNSQRNRVDRLHEWLRLCLAL